jgi:hypothetical protein
VGAEGRSNPAISSGIKSKTSPGLAPKRTPSHSAIPITRIAEEPPGAINAAWAESYPSLGDDKQHGGHLGGGASSMGTIPAYAHGYLTLGTSSVGTPSLVLSETETTTFRGEDDNLSTTVDGSYMGHVRAQSSGPKKWLNDVDIEPYLRLPGSSAGGGFAGPSRSNRGARQPTFFREPLLEELLPSSRKEALFPALHGSVLTQDTFAAYAFLILFVLMLLMGGALCLIYPSDLRDTIIC